MFGRDRGDRGALVALGMMLAAVLVVAVLGAGEPPNPEITQTGNHQIPSNQHQHVSETISAFYPWQDSYAQWLMAFFSVLATGVSFWAVRLVRDTLEQSRSATTAAFQANEISREIGRSQTRAYLSVKTIEAQIESGMLVFYATVENSGQTPAKKIRADCNLTVDTGEIYNVLAGKGTGQDHFVRHKPVFVGESDFVSVGKGLSIMFLWAHTDMKADHFDWLLTGKGLQVVDFRITWRDVYGEDQTIVFSAIPDKSADVQWEKTTKFMSRRVHWPSFKIHYHQQNG
jgi:hypothetical protein